MIVVCGIPSEPPLALVLARLRDLDVAVTVVDQREWAASGIDVRVDGGRVSGTLRTPDRFVDLGSVRATMTRLMDDRRLPDVVDEPEGSPRRQACRDYHAALAQWIELTPGRVLNRARDQFSNGSKPYQARRIRAAGFSIPASLITNDPDEVDAFRRRHGRIIYKSASGVRSIVREFGAQDQERIDLVRWCPVQFQEYVEGRDVRVHVVGHEVFATAVDSDGIDYRYAVRDGGSTTLSPIELPAEVADACIRLAADLGLALAGIDLRFAPDGRIVCFEVNPSPGYSYYEDHTGQPIAAAIARHLAAA